MRLAGCHPPSPPSIVTPVSRASGLRGGRVRGLKEGSTNCRLPPDRRGGRAREGTTCQSWEGRKGEGVTREEMGREGGG